MFLLDTLTFLLSIFLGQDLLLIVFTHCPTIFCHFTELHEYGSRGSWWFGNDEILSAKNYFNFFLNYLNYLFWVKNCEPRPKNQEWVVH